jgi:hypothetical protein
MRNQREEPDDGSYEDGNKGGNQDYQRPSATGTLNVCVSAWTFLVVHYLISNRPRFLLVADGALVPRDGDRKASMALTQFRLVLSLK